MKNWFYMLVLKDFWKKVILTTFGVAVSKTFLECINGKKLIFFIDALEFIADCAETKFELLQYLYDMAAEYQNVYIVTSCRTSDKNAFIKLETNFSIKKILLESIWTNYNRR